MAARGSDRDERSRGFGGYRSVQEWREATFGDIRKTWDPSRKGGFGGYKDVHDWRKATFGTRDEDKK
jgi:hypothetical protein